MVLVGCGDFLPLTRVFPTVLGDGSILCISIDVVTVGGLEMLYWVNFVVLVMLLGWEACVRQPIPYLF